MATLVIGAAVAKGNFQAQGLVSEVQTEGDNVIFKFVGSLSLYYATAPASSPESQGRTLDIAIADVKIRISHWTKKYEPSEEARVPDTETAFTNLAKLAASGRKVVLSVDNPSLKFSNLGILVAIDGTYVYAQESPY